MGGNATYRHRPRVQDCVFRGQSDAGIRVLDASNSHGIDPRFFQCRFENAPYGVKIEASASGATIYPDVEECDFERMRAAGIYLDDMSPRGANVGGLVQQNRFSNSLRGIHIRSSALTTDFRVLKSSFRDLSAEGVFVQIDYPRDPAATIIESSFLRCGTGVRYCGALRPGPFSLTLHNSVARRCGTGFEVDLRGRGTLAQDWRSNLATRCRTGYRVSVS